MLSRQEEKKILDKVMGADIYDARIRPSGINKTGDSLHSELVTITYNFPDDPTTVRVNIFVRSFSKIDDVKMVSGEDNGNNV